MKYVVWRQHMAA